MGSEAAAQGEFRAPLNGSPRRQMCLTALVEEACSLKGRLCAEQKLRRIERRTGKMGKGEPGERQMFQDKSFWKT